MDIQAYIGAPAPVAGAAPAANARALAGPGCLRAPDAYQRTPPQAMLPPAFSNTTPQVRETPVHMLIPRSVQSCPSVVFLRKIAVLPGLVAMQATGVWYASCGKQFSASRASHACNHMVVFCSPQGVPASRKSETH